MERLPKVVHNRISNRILSLENNPRPKGAKKLSARDEYRLRVGNYRILYTVSDSESAVTIIAVGHRREVYR
ncbi:MAG: type II toxin-antitoxin system RelE/ParE family toxin [Chloroflexi bacterium]|nr:type II toxin-antitoxin system RelE/ParE family toxin [Chloroflexota bacterium]